MISKTKILNTHIRNIEFVVLDLETTGLSIYEDRIIEIGAVRLKNGRKTDKFYSLINPQKPISPYASKKHGIYNHHVLEAPISRAIRKDFCHFIEGCVLVGHNIINFDCHFLYRELNVTKNTLFVDTLALSRLLFPDEHSHSLDAVSARLKIRNMQSHRALHDVKTTMDAFLKFIKLGRTKFKTLQDII